MNRKIKVAFFAEMLIDDFDGASRTMFQLINRIPKDKFEFLFITGTAPNGDFPYPYKVIPSLKIPKNEDYRLAMPAFAFIPLHMELNEFKPDVLHVSTPSLLGRFALEYSYWHDLPVISIYHTHFISYIDYYFEKLPALVGPVKNFVIKRNKSFYNKCNIIYIPSKSLAEELRSYGFNDDGFKIWRRGMDTSLFSPNKRDITLYKAQRDQGKSIIFFASRLVWEKNLNTLLKVYNLAKDLGRNFQFVIAGDGVAKSELIEKMPDAIFLGMLNHEQLSKFYASSDVFFFPSNTETYGNVVVEAMASGLPCVVADAGGPKDLVDQYVNGIKCDAYDAHSYLNAIESILNDEDLRKKIIANGISFANSLSWDSLAEEYFQDIINLSKSKRAISA